ncbi:MAG: hypothetical protein AAGC92_07920 [Pseudomonadota bacterium]
MPSRVNGLTRRRVLGGSVAAVGALAAPHVARAQGVVLRSNHPFGPNHLLTFDVLEPWGEMMAELTDGRVVLERLPAAVGPPPVTYEALRTGECDISYSVHGYSGDDAFPRARLGQFSYLGDSWGASPVFAQIYLNYLRGAEEHDGIKLLTVFEHGPGQLFLRDPNITNPSQLVGLRFRNSGGYISRLLTDLGATAIPMPPQAVAPAMASGEIDGVAFPYEGALTFGLIPETGTVIELPGGFYNASWLLGVNQARWDLIEPRDQRAIEGISGVLISELAGKAWDSYDYLGREACLEAGVDVRRANPLMDAAVRRIAQKYEAQWILQMNAEGFDGAGLLAEMRRRTRVEKL